MRRCIDKITLYFMTVFIVMILCFGLVAPQIASYMNNKSKMAIDMTNRTVGINSTVKHAMLFAPMPWHYLSIDETDEHLSAIALYMKVEANQTLLGKLFPNISYKNEAFTTVGAVPLGVEQILYEKPDAVLTWAWFAQPLERVDAQGVIELKNSDEMNEATLFRLLGKLTGKEERAQLLLKRYEREMNRLQKSSPTSKKIGFLVFGGENLFYWNGNWKGFNTTVHSIGGFNIAESQSRFSNGVISIEEVIRMNPSVIFIFSYYDNKLMPKDIYDNPALQGIDAVRHKQVYRMPSGASRMSGPVESPLLMEWMARLLHPEVQWDEPFRERVRQTYREVYSYSMNESELDDYLRVKENRISANYERIYK